MIGLQVLLIDTDPGTSHLSHSILSSCPGLKLYRVQTVEVALEVVNPSIDLIVVNTDNVVSFNLLELGRLLKRYPILYICDPLIACPTWTYTMNLNEVSAHSVREFIEAITGYQTEDNSNEVRPLFPVIALSKLRQVNRKLRAYG